VRHFFHQLEVGAHRIRQASHLAETRNQDNLGACFLVNVDEHGLVQVLNMSVVLLLEVVLVGDGLPVAVLNEAVLWRSLEVHIVHFVCPLVVGCQNGGSNESFLDFDGGVASGPVLDVGDKVEHRVGAQNLVHDVDVEQDTLFEHLERAGEARPYLDVVVRNARALVGVEEVAPNLLELDLLEHRVEEHFHEH